MAQKIAIAERTPEPARAPLELKPLKESALVLQRADQEDQWWKLKPTPGMDIINLHERPELWGAAGKKLKVCDRLAFDSPDGWVTDYIMVIDHDGQKPTLDMRPGGGIRKIMVPGRLPKGQTPDGKADIKWGADVGNQSGFACYSKIDGQRLTGFSHDLETAKAEYLLREGRKI